MSCMADSLETRNAQPAAAVSSRAPKIVAVMKSCGARGAGLTLLRWRS
jgi:hypothetical protein